LQTLLKIGVLTIIGAIISGCISTQEMPLAPNVVRLDTEAGGLLFVGQAPKQTLRRAAELTLQNGYSHFKLEQADVGQGSQIAGVYSTESVSAFGGPYSASAFGTGFSTPIYRRTAHVGVTVIMFHANEPGAQGAFDAAAVLQRLSSN
jgi:hypothetical protein